MKTFYRSAQLETIKVLTVTFTENGLIEARRTINNMEKVPFHIGCAWKPSIGEKLVARCEFNNPMDKHAVRVVKNTETVGHLPREFSRTAWYFLAHGGEISIEVIGRRRHCKQLCGGMEIPCQ